MKEARTRPRSRLSPWLPALSAIICLAGLIDWLSAETQRLYVDDHSDARKQVGSVWQHFAIKNNQVVPQIVLRDNARLVFPLHLRVPRTLHFRVKPRPSAFYELHWVRDGKRESLIAETLAQGARREIPLPRGVGELEINQQGVLDIFDLRLVRPVFLWPLYAAAGLALFFSGVIQIRAGTPRIAEVATLVLTLSLSLFALESVLRTYRFKLPGVILAARSELGLVVKDGRWIDPARYKLRLRPNLDTMAEWRVGDIARLGFIAKNLSRPVLHRFAIRTDAEGFRNAAVREKIDLAALGDSFTDGTTSPAEETWPARLEQRTGKVVQNYATSGFGPQQARYVLQDFVLSKKPRWAVLAFFLGNDLHDAEAFADWERSTGKRDQKLTGPKIDGSFRRGETLYLWTVVRVGAESVNRFLRGGADEMNQPRPAVATERPRFDRGMFQVPVEGRTLQFAFFPPYLQKLGTPRAVIESTRGWEITRSTLEQMKAECAAHGTEFVLLLVPSKDHVYWPLTERTFPAAELQGAIDFYSKYNNMPLRLDDVRSHRLALNELLRDFCATQDIRMLDLTGALEAEVAAGREVFFPDDTHWNAAGHEVAARELARFLALAP